MLPRSAKSQCSFSLSHATWPAALIFLDFSTGVNRQDILCFSNFSTNNPPDSSPDLIRLIDADTIVLSTQYSGMKFREEIRLLNGDNLRLRQTVGYDDSIGEVRLVGQYYEERTL